MSAIKRVLCNRCGKELTEVEKYNMGNFVVQFFYPSKNDGNKMQFALCTECSDKIAYDFIAKCEIKPIVTDIFGHEEKIVI